MNWEKHLFIGTVLSCILIGLFSIYTPLFKTVDPLTVLVFGIIMLISPLIPDLDHGNGKLKNFFEGIGLTMAILGLIIHHYIPFFNLLTMAGIIIASLAYFISKFSKHRGKWHSLSAGIIYAGLLSFINIETVIIGFVGFYSHLVLDKIPFKVI